MNRLDSVSQSSGRVRLHLMLVILAFLSALLLIAVQASSQTVGSIQAQSTDEPPIVLVLTFNGPVTPVLRQYLESAITSAQVSDAEAIVLQLDTPGGSVDVTKSITQLMLASPVPIVVYVAPAGAQAGSAGTFVTLAAHAAAMAPGASIGAASPVDMSGSDMDATMREKLENILSADVENLAERRGQEATEWAIAAVRDAEAATAQRALALGVIDFLAEDVNDLLLKLDGFEVAVQGEPVTLNTADAIPEPQDLSPLQQFLNFISNPSIATLLLSLGILGLFVEIRTPGFGLPGIVGGIALLLAFFGLGQLDANLVGIALIAVAFALFVAEAFTPTFGALALGGVAAFILGAALLFNTTGVQTPWATIIIVGVASGAFVLFVGAKALAAQRRRPMTGAEALIGERAQAKSAFTAGETGSVFLQGEWWNARLLSGAVEADEAVRVVAKEGFTLVVEPIQKHLDV